MIAWRLPGLPVATSFSLSTLTKTGDPASLALRTDESGFFHVTLSLVWIGTAEAARGWTA